MRGAAPAVPRPRPDGVGADGGGGAPLRLQLLQHALPLRGGSAPLRAAGSLGALSREAQRAPRRARARGLGATQQFERRGGPAITTRASGFEPEPSAFSGTHSWDASRAPTRFSR